MPNTFAIQSVTVPLTWAEYFTATPTQYSVISTGALLDRIVSLGANDVRLTGSLGILDSASDNSYSPPPSQSIESLKTFTDAAHAKGISITWIPFTTINGVIGGDPTQASDVRPSDPAAWFASYSQMVLEQARVAQAIGAARFSIMTDAEQYAFQQYPQLTTPMLNLIAQVRTIFTGQLTSLTGTSNGIVEAVPLPILKALDIIGLGLFPTLTTKTDPTLAELQTGLHSDVNGEDVIANLQRLAAATGKPIWISDFAQSSYDGWLRHSPNKYDPNANFIADNSEQSLGYQAFFNELAKFGYGWFQGLSVQNISRIENANGLVAKYLASNVGENFWGKPGEQVLRGYYTGQTSLPILDVTGSKYGESLQGGFGVNILRAGPQSEKITGGPINDTIYSSTGAQAAAQELKLKVVGAEVYGALPTFAVKVNGAYIPLTFNVETSVSGTAAYLSIPIFDAGKINSIEIVKTNWFFGGLGAGLNRYLRIQEISLNGVTLANSGATYRTAYGETRAFTGDTVQGGAVAYNTSAVSTSTPLTVTLAGAHLIDGGAGRDTVIYAGTATAYTVSATANGWQVQKPGGSVDQLRNVEVLQFADRSISLSPVVLPAAVETAFGNILRIASANDKAAAVTAEIDAGLTAGTMTNARAVAELVKAADATTSVATLSYQFFTGKIPGGPGYDYLVSPTGPNANNLNSAYYQSFNLENRYINFAVNLGKNGEGQAKFAAEYGALTLAQATKKAYGVIFGVEPNDAKVAALLAGGRDLYFDSYGRDGPNGVGTKAAMVGWLLAEAEKADIGMYARANAAFLTDLADGAAFAIDLVGVYGKAEFNYAA